MSKGAEEENMWEGVNVDFGDERGSDLQTGEMMKMIGDDLVRSTAP